MEKVFVKVDYQVLTGGAIRPTRIHWHDGRTWNIDKTLHSCTSEHDFKGIRYKFCSLDTLVRVANELNVSTDDLLIDSLTNTIKVSNHEFAAILSDCSDYEMRVLLDIVNATKQAMREYKYLTRPSRR